MIWESFLSGGQPYTASSNFESNPTPGAENDPPREGVGLSQPSGVSVTLRDKHIELLKWLFARWQERASKVHKDQYKSVWQIAVQQAKSGTFNEWIEGTGREMKAMVKGYDLTNEAYTGAELMRVAKEVLL
jgi:hypothetical protein